MKIAAIDIGSNSVRLMMWADGKTLYKKLKTTRLGAGLNFSHALSREACERTAQAVAEFFAEGKAQGAEKIYVFATAAVRSASNPQLFTRMVKELCGAEVDVISGEREAELGLVGALGNGDGGIIDVGGASTEVTLRVGGKVVYSHSADIGTVRISDAVGRDLKKIDKFIGERIAQYDVRDFGAYSFYAVGGTATRLAAIKRGITSYDASALHGTSLSVEEVRMFAKMLTDMPVEEIAATTICKGSADVIGGGAALLSAVMSCFHIHEITVSESDNLEGYVLSET